MARFHIGIDDTDNAESRGTGFKARTLAAALDEAGLARVRGVTRHQLFVHPDIPYTSHNSSLCLDAEMDEARRGEVVDFCRAFLAAESADGSDAGLCVAAAETLPAEVVEFGRAAKSRVIERESAWALAGPALHLEGVTGDHGGVIGALAAVGLRRSGHDGRFVWAAGVRELSGVATASDLLAHTGIEVVRTREGEKAGDADRILIDSWPRPVLLDDRAVLLVERTPKGEETHERIDWKLLPRDVIRSY